MNKTNLTEPQVRDERLTGGGEQKKQPIAVCVKPLDFLDWDASFRIAEWVELQFLLGMSKVKAHTAR